MADIEQPEPSSIDAPSTFEEIVEPIQPDMPDAMLTSIAYSAAMTSTYYLTLIQAGVPVKQATRFTHHWMDMCGVDE